MHGQHQPVVSNKQLQPQPKLRRVERKMRNQKEANLRKRRPLKLKKKNSTRSQKTMTMLVLKTNKQSASRRSQMK